MELANSLSVPSTESIKLYGSSSDYLKGRRLAWQNMQNAMEEAFLQDSPEILGKFFIKLSWLRRLALQQAFSWLSVVLAKWLTHAAGWQQRNRRSLTPKQKPKHPLRKQNVHFRIHVWTESSTPFCLVAILPISHFRTGQSLHSPYMRHISYRKKSCHVLRQKHRPYSLPRNHY